MRQFRNYFAIISLILFILSPLAIAAKLDVHLESKMRNMDSAEVISVLVFMKDQAALDKVKGKPQAVLQRLKKVAKESQVKSISTLLTMQNQSNPQGQSAVAQYKSFWVVNCISITGTKDAVYQLLKNSDVDKIIENPVIPSPSPAAVSVESESSPDNVQWNISKIGADRVWEDFGCKGEGVVIGTIDTGVDTSPPDLDGKMAHIGNGDIGWFDAVNGSTTPTDLSDTPHGTHITGIMVGGDHSGDSIGIAPNAKYYMAKAFTTSGGSGADILECAQWLMDPDNDSRTDDFPDVINCSWGGSTPNDTWFESMVRSWEAMGIFSAFAAGNSGPASGTIGEPGGYPEACAVGATTSTDEIANFSSRGPVDWQDRAGMNPPARKVIKPDISAPGQGINSTVPGGYSSWDGTSMATPHITATAALLLQATPQISVEEIKRVLANTSIDLGTEGKDNSFGYGRVDAYRAVSAVVNSGTLRGVVSGDGQVLSNVLIEAGNFTTGTNTTGEYSLFLQAGTYTIRASRTGYSVKEISDVVITQGQTATLDIDLEPAGSGIVQGIVTDVNSSKPLEATVTVIDTEISDKTDASTGEYSIRLPEGQYELKVTASGYRPQTASITSTANENITRDFALESYDIAEYNDDFDSAFSVSIGDTIEASINPAGDLDFYSFEGTAGQAVSIDIDARSLSPASKLDSVLSLYDNDQTLISENDDVDGNYRYDSLIQKFSLSYTGIYYIRVSSFWESTGGKDYFYNLKIEESAPADAYEPNNDFDHATTMDYDQAIPDATIAPNKDVDFFKFSSVSGLSVTIDVDAKSLEPPSRLDSALTLYNAEFEQISYNDDFSGKTDSKIKYFLNRNATLYIKVEDYFGNGGDDYTYKLRLEKSGTPDNLGDVNGKNGISMDDASLILRYVVSLITLTTDEYYRADVSGDEDVTAYDAALITQYVRKVIDTFPADLRD